MIKLTCNSCGGKLEITPDIERFACGHCGNEWIVNRGGGIISLKAVEEKLGTIEKNTKKSAVHSEAIASGVKSTIIKEEIQKLETELTAIGVKITAVDLNPQKKIYTQMPITYYIGIVASIIIGIVALVFLISGGFNGGCGITLSIIFISTVWLFFINYWANSYNGYEVDKKQQKNNKEYYNKNIEHYDTIERKIKNLKEKENQIRKKLLE